MAIAQKTTLSSQEIDELPKLAVNINQEQQLAIAKPYELSQQRELYD